MFVGLDVHKKYCYATVIDAEGELVSEGRFLNQIEELDNFLKSLDPSSEVVMEASAIWEQLYDHVDLGAGLQPVLEDYLAVLHILNERIVITTKQLEQQAKSIPQVELLTSVPGIGTYSALLLLAEIADINRFHSSKQLCAYAGLVPRVHQSGTTEYYGRITKEGNRWMRWILVQAVHQTVRRDNVIHRFFKKLARKKGMNIALVASARKLLCYIYQMLKSEVRFEELKVVQAQGHPVYSTGH